jgi:ABC-type amino acid transport substrate-binding protein
MVAVLVLCVCLSVHAQSDPITVATREMPPFSFLSESGQWEGVAIELWDELARELEIEYRIEAVDTISNLLAGVASGRYALAVGGITITSEREKVIDFTQPFLSSSLALASRQKRSPWHHVARGVFNWEFMTFAMLFIVLLFVVGWLVWLFERKHNAAFAEHRGRGIGSGFWWAAVTMTTVGYGDKSPKTAAGRILAVVWMFVSVIIISMFTATVVSSLTEGTLQRQPTVEQMLESRVGTVASSTGEQFLENYHLLPHTYDSIIQVIDALQSNTLDAVVYDLPVLRYYRRLYKEKMDVFPLVLQRQDYGIVMPQDAPFRNDLNVALLRFVRSGNWERIRERYLGHAGSPQAGAR